MKLKIISDGTPYNTRILNAETGENLEGVTSVEWRASAMEAPNVTLEMVGVLIEAEGEYEVTDLPTIRLIGQAPNTNGHRRLKEPA